MAPTAKHPSGQLSTAKPAGATWLDYFAARLHHQCVEGSAGKPEEPLVTQTVTAIRRRGSTTILSLRDAYEQPGDPQATAVANYTYTFPPNGTVEALPGSDTNGVVTMNYQSAVVYPPLSVLRSGGSLTTVQHATWSTTDAQARAQLEQELLAGETTAKVNLTYRVSAARAPQQLVTPAGTFRHLLGIRVKLVSMHLLNARPQYLHQIQRLSAIFGHPDVIYFARGLGVVGGYGDSLLGDSSTLVTALRCTG
ncbi:MAG: hypothetical protein ACRDRN_24350 [Sciscionella sp.]